jgi:hypothetical protein
MQTQRWLGVMPWSGALLALLFGIAARDCILLASAAMLAIYLARTQAESREPTDLVRGAIQCWVVGAASLLAALALVAMIAGLRAGLWDGNGLPTSAMLTVLAVSVLATGATVIRSVLASGRWAEAAGFVVVGAAVVGAALAARSLDANGPCLFALVIAAIAARSGWTLARMTGNELARSAVRI